VVVESPAAGGVAAATGGGVGVAGGAPAGGKAVWTAGGGKVMVLSGRQVQVPAIMLPQAKLGELHTAEGQAASVHGAEV
jgi:hypothetical protein